MSQSDVEQQFGSAAANYRTSAVHASGEDLDALVHAAKLDATMQALDLGCGAGHTTLAVAPHVHEVVAYDLTAPMLAQVQQLARERGQPNVRTQRGDVHQLPFGDASFDRVVSRYSAHHWDDPQVAMHEIVRVLRPSGRFVLSDIIAPPEARTDSTLQTLEMLRDPSHVRDHSVAEWTAMLSAAGFTVEHVLSFRITLQFERWLARINTPAVFANALRALFAGLQPEQQRYFALPSDLDADFTFEFEGAVLVGQLGR